MKHSLIKLIVPVIFSAGIAACGIADISGPPEPKLSGGFTCECTVSTALIPPGDESGEETEFVFSGKLSRLGMGFYELEINSPETVSGMKISSRDGDISSSLGELSLDISAENVPHKSPVYALFTAVDNMAAAFESGGELVSGDDGGWVYQCDGLSAVFDGEGYLISMAAASPKMKAEFSGFTPSEGMTEAAPSGEEGSSSETTSEEVTSSSSVSETTISVTVPSETTLPSITTSLETTAPSITTSETTPTQAETTVPATTME